MGPLARFGLKLGVVALIAVGGLAGWLDFKVRAEFEGKRWSVPARVYARPLSVYPEQTLGRDQLLAELASVGYQKVRTPTRPGQYSASASRVEIHTREFAFWDGDEPARRFTVSFSGNTVTRLSAGKAPIALARLEPALITRIYPNHREDRILKRLGELPVELVAGLVMVEDRHFLQHHGISFRGIARAMFANLAAGGAVQGGSTLTQQLAKNFFLTAERTLWRKFREAIIAVILEARYDKETILAAYMNEIYLGQQGANAVHGFGSAAWHYFGRPVDELALHESALLIALARGASYYNPRRHPERALERRNLVLTLMAERGVIEPDAAKAASQRDLGVRRSGGGAANPHPAFVQLVREQLRRDYREADLRTEGLRIFTTLDPVAQAAAESALKTRLASLEKARKLPRGQLQGAVVMVEPASGQVLAVVGDRDPRAHGFNRALNARRPIGSLVKPAVYLAALEAGYRLDSPLVDASVSLPMPSGKVWAPSNYDGEEYGEVPMVEALSRSLNLATVRLGLDLGVEDVAARIRSLGVERDVKPLPSLLLGTLELSPLEVARLYQPLAAGGFQVPLRTIRDVTDASGQPIGRYPLSTRNVADPIAVAELQEAMVDVVENGTARYAGRTLPAHLRLAGKTGTTDDLRDSWFAGFGTDRLAVVWVGRDDNKPAKLTGSSGALRVWTDVMAASPPRSLPPAAPVRTTTLAQNQTGPAAGGCEGDLLGGFIERLLGSGCAPAPLPDVEPAAGQWPPASEGGDQ